MSTARWRTAAASDGGTKGTEKTAKVPTRPTQHRLFSKGARVVMGNIGFIGVI